jgi:hypothetical protein
MYIYTFTRKITLHYLVKEKKIKEERERESNTRIWWILEKKFYTPNSGCYIKVLERKKHKHICSGGIMY